MPLQGPSCDKCLSHTSRAWQKKGSTMVSKGMPSMMDTTTVHVNPNVTDRSDFEDLKGDVKSLDNKSGSNDSNSESDKSDDEVLYDKDGNCDNLDCE